MRSDVKENQPLKDFGKGGKKGDGSVGGWLCRRLVRFKKRNDFCELPGVGNGVAGDGEVEDSGEGADGVGTEMFEVNV